MDTPDIDTPRLRLRAHTRADFEASRALWNEPAVFRHITGKPSGEQQVWGRLLNYLGLWKMLGYGYWAAEDKATGAYVGELGFADFCRDIQPSIRGIPELGWALAPRFHGLGYATEALRAVTAWADASLDAPRAVCLIDPENQPSFKVAAKLGFIEIARPALAGRPIVLLQRPRGAARP